MAHPCVTVCASSPIRLLGLARWEWVVRMCFAGVGFDLNQASQNSFAKKSCVGKGVWKHPYSLLPPGVPGQAYTLAGWLVWCPWLKKRLRKELR